MAKSTYHGITRITCEGCGHSTGKPRVMEQWNDEWGACPQCKSSEAVFRLDDGGLTRYDADGDVDYEITVEFTVDGHSAFCTCGYRSTPSGDPSDAAVIAHAVAAHGFSGG
jgi:hypothetical protein